MDSYQQKQDQIYQGFRESMKSGDTLQLHGNAGTLDAGCLLILRYSADVTRPLQHLSQQIAARIPALVYDNSNLHTTLATGPKLPALQQADADSRILFNRYQQFFANVARPLAETLLAEIEIELGELLYNNNSLIAAGNANPAFWTLAETLTHAAAEQPLPLTMPWGSHLTVSRFLPQAQQPDPILPLLSDVHLPASVRPMDLELVWFECDVNGFRFVQP
jgi:hypothetical protein